MPKYILETDTLDINRIKQYKKAKFIDRKLFGSFDQTIKDYINGTAQLTITHGILLSTKPSFAKETENVLHNTIRRKRGGTDDSMVEEFYGMQTTFSKQLEYTTIIHSESKELVQMLEAGLALTADRGVGKRTSIGLGAIEIIESKKIDLPPPSGAAVLLSSWLPNANEPAIPETYSMSFFQPIQTSKHSGTKPLKGISYIESGAVLKHANTLILGRMENLGSENNPNLFPGYALAIGGLNP